ncbi:hypothetical protein FRC09_010513 [Ceratobasidium sp. 395]|nr:hypothetical protein FRC09_010513 [Ceratobasidium sp. 395]
MLFSGALLALSTLSSVLATPHFETGRPSHAKRTPKYYARAEPKNSKLGIHAQMEFVGYRADEGQGYQADKGKGRPTFVKMRVLSGLTNDPSLGGPFSYHIHTNPVPADGNCTKTLAHLDTLSATEGILCNANYPQYCQNGDLSGKHGKLIGTPDGRIETFGYSDDFLRFFPEDFSILGRSVVIHSANKTRLACANITSYLDGTANESFEPTHKPSKYVKNYPKAAPVAPGPPVMPFNGTTPDDAAANAAYPYPLPVPALTLEEAPNVKLGSITHKVRYNNTEQTITQPKETKSNNKPPFTGFWDTTW